MLLISHEPIFNFANVSSVFMALHLLYVSIRAPVTSRDTEYIFETRISRFTFLVDSRIKISIFVANHASRAARIHSTVMDSNCFAIKHFALHWDNLIRHREHPLLLQSVYRVFHRYRISLFKLPT